MNGRLTWLVGVFNVVGECAFDMVGGCVFDVVGG